MADSLKEAEKKWVQFHVADKIWYEGRGPTSPHPRTSIEERRVNKFSACPFCPRFMVGREISLFSAFPLFPIFHSVSFIWDTLTFREDTSKEASIIIC